MKGRLPDAGYTGDANANRIAGVRGEQIQQFAGRFAVFRSRRLDQRDGLRHRPAISGAYRRYQLFRVHKLVGSDPITRTPGWVDPRRGSRSGAPGP